MQRLGLHLIFLSTAVFSACKNSVEPPLSQETAPKEVVVLPKAEIDSWLKSQAVLGSEKVWDGASDELLWSAVVHGEGLLSLRVSESDEAVMARLIEEGKVSVAARYPEIQRQDLLVGDYATFLQLRDLSVVSELEPAAYPDSLSNKFYSSGLGCAPSPDGIDARDYSWMAPGARVPWNFFAHGIPKAWEQSSGEGVTVGLVDTGTSDHQSVFSPAGFSQGSPLGRFIERRGTYVDSMWRWKKRTDGPHDRCGHGTYMSGLLAAPRTEHGTPPGVAYGANLVVYRGSKDVFLDAYHEKKGVAKAILELANRDDVKIISLSMGYIFHVRNIADAIRYAHRRGKMIVAAAGTSFRATNGVGVVFPARMNETIAVTGLLDTHNIKACVDCHYGPEVDFALVVQRSENPHRRSVSVGYRDGTMAYVGGSSAATALLSGMAALIWSKHPDWTRDQVRRFLEQHSDLYPNRDANYGFGRVRLPERRF